MRKVDYWSCSKYLSLRRTTMCIPAIHELCSRHVNFWTCIEDVLLLRPFWSLICWVPTLCVWNHVRRYRSQRYIVEAARVVKLNKTGLMSAGFFFFFFHSSCSPLPVAADIFRGRESQTTRHAGPLMMTLHKWIQVDEMGEEICARNTPRPCGRRSLLSCFDVNFEALGSALAPHHFCISCNWFGRYSVCFFYKRQDFKTHWAMEFTIGGLCSDGTRISQAINW